MAQENFIPSKSLEKRNILGVMLLKTSFKKKLFQKFLDLVAGEMKLFGISKNLKYSSNVPKWQNKMKKMNIRIYLQVIEMQSSLKFTKNNTRYIGDSENRNNLINAFKFRFYK